ncbi:MULTISPECIES: cache domain-containing sensor histidine kinase [unclassified Clostridium]|uniref:cache domain-containing sensor histidine kinase n=1 Tax=unclassified Clostridium TaxID=2614128 RepID=UPI00290E04D8|nr:histidine kinase [Clostridium sp.]MDU5105799.1 histidine kinase [Clostridium sp.]
MFNFNKNNITRAIVNNLKIRTKLLIVYFTIVAVTVLTVGVYLTTNMRDIVIENSKKDARANSNQIKQRLIETLRLATSTSDMIYQDENLHKIVKTKYESYGENVKVYNEYPILSNYLRYYNDLSNIRLYVDNDSILDNSNIVKVNNEVRNSSWYKKAREDKGVITWLYRYDEISKDYSLSLIRDISSDVDGHIGVLVISIQTSKFRKLISEQPYPITILIDGTVVVSGEYEEGSKVIIVYNQDEVDYYNSKKEEVSTKNSYAISDKFKVDKSFNNIFEVIVSVPIYKIMAQSRDAVNKSIAIISITITISLVIILYFSKQFSKRFGILNEEMSKVVEGNFEIKESIDGNDEIAGLYKNLYTMVDSIKNLINEVYVKEIEQKKLIVKQKDAEFKMLASQINPHFLYNTLETIRMRAFCNGDRELADIVKKLGKIMRRNLEVTNEVVTLKSELDMIQNYLEIQSLRFKGKVEYDFRLEVDPEEYLILPLLLQPIVENAFVHGLESSTKLGKIEVSIYDEVGYLIVEISDNGVGITKEKLDYINGKLDNYQNNNKKSIGISNVNERIKMFYGEEYGLYILSSLDIGTKVIILLPSKKGEINSA